MIGLGPLAVLPERQRKGIGSQLVTGGLEECIKQGYEAVVVLGHPWLYPRFGFVPSVKFDINCEFEVPEDVFMVKELRPGSLAGKSGTVKYHPLFSEL